MDDHEYHQDSDFLVSKAFNRFHFSISKSHFNILDIDANFLDIDLIFGVSSSFLKKYAECVITEKPETPLLPNIKKI